MTNKAEHKIRRPEWLDESVWPFEIRAAKVDGNDIFYTDEGNGPPVLLVHDGMWSFVWGQLIAELRQSFRVITLDFPGSGLSPKSNHVAGLEADSHLLESFVDHLGLSGFTLALHDLGGSVGLGMAARRPDLVNGLALVNTFAWPARRSSLRRMLKVMSGRLMTSINTSTNLIPRMTSGRFGIGRHLDTQAKAAFRGGFIARESRMRFHDLIRSALMEEEYLGWLETQLSETLANKPALTVFGEKNDPFGFQETFREHLADLEEMVVPGGNHFPMADDPHGLAERIAIWHSGRVSG